MKNSSAWKVFKLLMWKNYLLHIRKPYSIIFDFIMPLFCCILLNYMRSQIQPEVFHSNNSFSPLLADNFSIFDKFIDSSKTSSSESLNTDTKPDYTITKLKTNFSVNPEILYSPKNKIIDEILSQLEDELLQLGTKITAISDSKELEMKMMNINYLVGIEFPDEYKNLKSLPSILSYNVRFPGEHRTAKTINVLEENWNTRHLFSLFPLTSIRTNTSDDGSPVRYYEEGFLLIQSMIFESFMKALNKSSFEKIPKIYVQKFPYLNGFQDGFLRTSKVILSMLITVCFIYPCINIIKYIVVEKETKLKKIMRIMGISSKLHYFTWFVKSFIYLFSIANFVLILITVNWTGSERIVITKSSVSVIYVFIMTYCIVTIIFAFMISSLFQKSSIATAIAAFLWTIQITPYLANGEDYAYEEVPKIKKMIMSLMQNYAMSIGMRIVAIRETNVGVQWNNLFEKFNDDVSFGEMMIMMIACGVWKILVIIGIKYLRKFMKSKNFIETEYFEGIDCQNLNQSSNVFLRIQNLTKTYPNSSKPAIVNLNLPLYQDQITVLLGINGAGKSTTMAMLCGEIKPSSGTVIKNGASLLNSGKICHKSTGVAFQDNIIFNSLTVREHLIFFGRLKGNSKVEAENEAQKFMKILNLNPNDFASNLSGGMKRKLCMAIALCADSQLVILDEITSGVDPASRREIWNFLQSVKKNRSILMSTHYMLEAEIVADKIAVLCEGQLKAFGTPFDLKQKFSKTCKLTCVRQNCCDSQTVTDFVRQSIPNVKVSGDNGQEICYAFESDEVPKIYEVLERLEHNMNELHLESFGISSSTMDDVMERVDDIPDDEHGNNLHEHNITAWFNNQPYHTLPITLSVVHNAVLKAYFGSDFAINVGNKPLPYRNETKRANLIFFTSKVNQQVYLIISFALSVSYAILLIPVVKERVAMAKNMQRTVGIHPVTYWLSIFIWDLWIILIIALTTALTVDGTVANYDKIQSFDTRLENFYKHFGILTIFGISVLPITYVSSFIFTSASSGFIKLVLVYIIFGSTIFIIKSVFNEWLTNMPVMEFFFGKTFLPVPHNNFCDVMKRFLDLDNAKEFCNIQCKYFDICDKEEQCRTADQCCDTSYFAWTSKGVMWSITRYIVITIIGFYILYLVESKVGSKILNKFKSIISKFPIKFLNRSNIRKCSIELNPNTFNIDPDVEAEKRMVYNMSDDELKSYNLVLKNLSKNYQSKQAVKQICVAVKPGECFGLLGANGAGKTTTFRMLTGDLSITSGEIFIQGLNIKTNLKQIHKMIGYCGQFDAHIEELTGREILTFYAKCRGIEKHKIRNCVIKLATDFDFLSHLDKQIRYMSGGNKRKLSTAIALIGDPQVVIFLDEPTSFMDPLVKKKFWHQIAKLRDSGKTIILSSHSMDEVEVLCTRIAIMMNGEIKCLGSPQYLKSKFGQTIVVTLKLKKIEASESAKCDVKRLIDKELPGAILKEEFHDILIYHLTSKSFEWSKIFKTVELGKEKLDIIDDFTVNQSNMIQVFLQVTSDNKSL
ncbi:phospholipid-transporting ATPase ABCA3-like [Chironomus tepperi]|uniref:phospholipid-transporting ATPase ABCA3-like n=1 Tax=Chironomus tepperi TaxID=113505 RepID=UPI00391EF93E